MRKWDPTNGDDVHDGVRTGRRVGSSIATQSIRMLLLLMLSTSPAFAQLHTLDVSQYLHTAWTAQDGYFRGIGGAMAQTADGQIWVLSANGLLRFDGIRFGEWTPPKGESLPGKPPAWLLGSRNGSLWLAGHGVAELRNDGTWHRYHELDSSSLVQLVEDQDGVIWAGVGGRPTSDSCSLFRIDRGKAECYKRPEIAGLDFSRLYVDRQGRLWADSKIGIWRILPGPPRLIQKESLPVDAFCEDSDGSLLYTSNGPIWKLSAEGKPENYLEKVDGTRITGSAMLRDSEGDLWIGTSGVGLVHLHEGRVDHFSSFDGLSSDFVNGIFEDREGNVWVMSPDGIDKFTKPAVPRLTRKQGLSSDAVLSVLTDRRGVTRVGTDNGLNELAADHLIQPSFPTRNRPVSALFETHTGRFLVASPDRNKTVVQNPGHMISDKSGRYWLEGYKTVFAFAEDGRRTLWAASRELGLLHLRENGELIKAFNVEQFGDYPLSVAFDPKRDGIWFTTHQGELLFLKDDKILERYGLRNGLGYGPIRVSQVDNDGGIWVTTKVGLAHLKDGKVSLLGRKNGLPCDALHWMRHDQDHNVWLYTECGLVSFSENDLLSWITQPSHIVTVTHYLDSTEGVENDANGGWFTPLTALTRDGRILFAMRTGLGVLDPRHLNQNAFPPPVHIEGIIADGLKIENNGRASLPVSAGVIHITYTALSFAAPRKVCFRYKLEGYDKDWSPPVSLREVTYTNLPPRDYSFRVIACNDDGVWNNEGATMHFRIPPAWFQTMWFHALCLALAMILTWGLYRLRVRQIAGAMSARFNERLAERTRIARELHDTFLQTIQGSKLVAANALKNPHDPVRTQRALEKLSEWLTRATEEGRAALHSLRTSTTETNELAAALRQALDSCSDESSMVAEFELNGEAREMHPIVRDEVYLIGYEAIRNAYMHSAGSRLHVQLTYGDYLSLSIRDDGTSIDPSIAVAGKAGHFGVPSMRERAARIGARLTIETTSNSGTDVKIVVPGKLAFSKARPSPLDKIRTVIHRRNEN
jgi:signal transduction histidine kinase/ligand-binding sensor domain-containing protein